MKVKSQKSKVESQQTRAAARGSVTFDLRPSTFDPRRRGVVAILAMLFIVIFGSLAAAMAIVSQGNIRTAQTYQGMNRSHAAAEAGMRFFAYRVDQIAKTIMTNKGLINQDQADIIWPELRDKIIAEMGNELHSLEPYQLAGEKITLGRIPLSDEPLPPTFQVIIERHPLVGENYDSIEYQRAPYNEGGGDNRFTVDGEPVTAANPVAGYWVRVKVTGRDGAYHRSVRNDFRIDKKVRFAILSRNRIMIGRNVLIKGSMGSRYTLTNYEHGHPMQVRDNFTGLDAQLDSWLDALEGYLATNDIDGDNRVRLADDRESADLLNAASHDRNNDGYVDAYDMFLEKFDASADGVLTEAEFTDTGGNLYDAQLWRVINELKYPPGSEFDWANKQYRINGGPWIDASSDLGLIDNNDNYTKIAGQLVLKSDKLSWENGAAEGPYQHALEDSIRTEYEGDAPLTFEAPDSQLAEFPPGAFDVSAYQAIATGDFAAQAAAANPNNGALPATYTAPSPATTEPVPFNSPHPYDFYSRPVYDNMVFTDVTIPKGTNALFRNCKFIGVTFVDTEADTNDENYNYAGMQNPDGSYKYVNVTATVNGAEVADTKALSNSLRFHNCAFEGVVVTAVPEGYAHVRNKLQFTGRTNFDIDAPGLTTSQKELFEKSTIMAPQYSLDMGSFDAPTDPNEIVTLEGTIVAGVFDIRGQATIDGSIITTYEPVPNEGTLFYGGNPASFNTTIGYFESAAGDAEGEIPPGGYGKIIIRYDPNRAMPDGITGSIEVKPDQQTYAEGG